LYAEPFFHFDLSSSMQQAGAAKSKAFVAFLLLQLSCVFAFVPSAFGTLHRSSVGSATMSMSFKPAVIVGKGRIGSTLAVSSA
jgi:hypothetical protein